MSLFDDMLRMAESIRSQPNVAPLLPCGHPVYNCLAKISGVGEVCLECGDWEQISDPLDGPVGVFRRKDDQ